MTSPITGSGGASQIGASASSATKRSDTMGSNEMNKDMFLKLMVAQLRYQDPTKPADGAEFLAQTAQFTMVEKLDELASAQHDMLSAQLMLGASNLVGRTVTYNDASGLPATGVVTSATFSGSSPTVRVGNMDVPLSSVREVRNTSTTGS